MILSYVSFNVFANETTVCKIGYTEYSLLAETIGAVSTDFTQTTIDLTGEHLYTASLTEKETLKADGLNYEDVAFNAATNEASVYRLYNAVTGNNHFYTTNEEEIEKLVKEGWKNEGVV